MGWSAHAGATNIKTGGQRGGEGGQVLVVTGLGSHGLGWLRVLVGTGLGGYGSR